MTEETVLSAEYADPARGRKLLGLGKGKKPEGCGESSKKVCDN